MKTTNQSTIFLSATTALAVFGWLFLRSGPLRPQPAPRLHPSPPEQNLGAVAMGERRPFEIVLRNDGSAPLQIYSIDPGCGCLQVDYPDFVAAGTSGTMRATFEPLPEWKGPVERTLIVYSNDPQQRRLVIPVRANIHRKGNEGEEP